LSYAFYKGQLKFKAQEMASQGQMGISASGRDYDNNAVIYGGTLTLDELAAYINSGSDGRHGDIQTIFHTLGIYPNEFNGQIDGANRQTLDGYVHKDGSVTLASGQTVARGVISAGRTYLDGSTADVFGLPIYWRPPAISMVPDSLSAFVHLVNGKFSWAVIKSCGNPVKVYGTPQISLQKYVRNVTKGTNWSTSVNADLGDTLEYKITYQVGDESLNDVYLYDTLKGEVQNHTASNREYLTDPTNLTPSWFQYHPDGINIHGYQDQRMLVWYAPGRAPRAYGEATFTTTVRTDTPREVTKIYNDAACYAGRIGVVFSNIVEVNINQPAIDKNLKIVKTASLDRVNFSETINTSPGKIIYFKIEFQNTGNVPLNNVNIKDTLPNKITYRPGNTYLYRNEGRTPLGDTITTNNGVNIGNYNPGETSYVIFQAKLDDNFPVGTTPLINSATGSAEGITKTDQATVNVGAGYNFTVSKTVSLDGKEFSKSVNTEPAQTVYFKIHVVNTGEAILEDLTLRDILPPKTEYIPGTSILYNQESPRGKKINDDIIKESGVNIGDYNRGAEGEVVFQIKLAEDFERGTTELRNVAKVWARGTNTQEDYSDVIVGNYIIEIKPSKSAINLTQGKDATKTVSYPGDIIEYELKTQNTGNRDETAYIVADDISDILLYANITDLKGARLEGNRIIYPEQEIKAGQEIINKFTVTIKPFNEWPPGGDYQMSNVYGNEIIVPVGFVNIVKSKYAFNETQNVPAITKKAKAGDVIRYTLNNLNNGNIIAQNYTVEEDIKDILEYAEIISFDEGGRIENNKIIWQVSTINPNQTVARSFKIRIKPENNWPVIGDLIITNIYGNKVDIIIEPSTIIKGVTASIVNTLTKTGTYILIIFTIAWFIFISIFSFRNRDFILEFVRFKK